MTGRQTNSCQTVRVVVPLSGNFEGTETEVKEQGRSVFSSVKVCLDVFLNETTRSVSRQTRPRQGEDRRVGGIVSLHLLILSWGHGNFII